MLGGFDVRWAGRAVRRFESQKVRGLLAYLACHRHQAVSRDHLANLLWAEKPDESALHNLRQALHNLRQALAAVDCTQEVVTVTHQEVRLGSQFESWVDLEQFEEAIRRGLTEAGADPYQLSRAASLYAGDFLVGFSVKDSPPFEEWMIAEQERQRGAIIDALRTLIESYLHRGEYRLGIQYASRLLAIDPLSESAHRYLMQLYALSGRRSRALSQYETLRNLLNAELAVEPLAETQELFQRILFQHLPPAEDGGEEGEPVGPLIPLVGRREAHAALDRIWHQVAEGKGHLTLLLGEAGVGKTRLAKSFVDAATAKRRAVVLRGRAYADSPLRSYEPFGEMVVGAFADLLPEDATALVEALSPPARAALVALEPQLPHLAPALADATAAMPADDADALCVALLEFLDRLRHSDDAARAQPMILMIDDFQWTDPASRRLLAALIPHLGRRPLWLLAACRDREAAAEWLVDDGGRTTVEEIVLGRLGPREVQEIASSLVGIRRSEEFGDFLEGLSDGLPLAVAELINHLWDEKALRPRGDGRWALHADPRDLATPPRELERLVQLRLRRLPTSARRLLAVAAIVGQRFDAELVRRADHEHLVVVDTAIRLMLERWLVRQFPLSWSHSRPEKDLVLFAKGARRGTFEFAHEAIRAAVLADINPLRRQVIHRDVAATLLESRGHEEEALCERLAYHELAGGEWERALPHLECAATKARAIGAHEIADWYLDRGLEALDRLVGQTSSETRRQELASRRRELERQRSGR